MDPVALVQTLKDIQDHHRDFTKSLMASYYEEWCWTLQDVGLYCKDSCRHITSTTKEYNAIDARPSLEHDERPVPPGQSTICRANDAFTSVISFWFRASVLLTVPPYLRRRTGSPLFSCLSSNVVM